jgi:osmotically inducible protein OsmC
MIIRPETILYRAEVSATGGRDGRATAVDGGFSVALSLPKELGGPGGDGTNPEQLFAAGYAACFLSAAKLVARTRKLVVANDASVTASVGMGPVTVGYALEVALKVSLPNMDHGTAQEVLEAAHERCPYSKATRDNIAVTVTLI